MDAGGLADAGGTLSLVMLGEGADGSAGEAAAGISVRVVVRDARIAGGDLVLLATLFDELLVSTAAGSATGCAAGAVFSPELATTIGAGAGDDCAGLEVDDATRGALSDMAWSYTNAPPITLTTIVPKAIPK